MKQVNMRVVDESNARACVCLNFLGSLIFLFGMVALTITTQKINIREKIMTGGSIYGQHDNVRHVKNDCASPGVNKRDNFFMETIIR